MQTDAETLRLIVAAHNEAARNVRAAVIAELRGLVERAYSHDHDPGVRYVYADSLENLIDELEAANV